MKIKSLHILLAALAFTWSVLVGAQQTPDSASFAALGAKLDSYMEAMAPLSVQEQEKECSFLIESCTDSLVRQYVALKLYSSYISSDVTPLRRKDSENPPLPYIKSVLRPVSPPENAC